MIHIYKKSTTSSCIFRGCEKGVGGLSLCLGFSSEIQVSISHRHTHTVSLSWKVWVLVPHRPLMVQIVLLKLNNHMWMLTFVFFFSLNQLEESPFISGKITHKITVVPTANLTVTCSVTNEFGTASRAINVSSCKYKVVVQSSHLSPILIFPED